MPEQLCYKAVRSEVEQAFGMPRECVDTCLSTMANALIQDAMLGDVALPDVLVEASTFGEAKRSDCVQIDEAVTSNVSNIG